MRALMVSSAERVPQLPDVPTGSEASVPGFNASAFVGLFAPAGTPAPIIEQLNAALNRVLRKPNLVERIDAYLGRPEVDPHGDPIPPADAHSLADGEDVAPRSLADCAAGAGFRLTRVLDQSPDFLRYLTDCGLTLGTVGEVERNPDGAGLMRIRVGERRLSLAIDAAGKLLVGDA